jgi:hypothetical protein
MGSFPYPIGTVLNATLNTSGRGFETQVELVVNQPVGIELRRSFKVYTNDSRVRFIDENGIVISPSPILPDTSKVAFYEGIDCLGTPRGFYPANAVTPENNGTVAINCCIFIHLDLSRGAGADQSQVTGTSGLNLPFIFKYDAVVVHGKLGLPIGQLVSGTLQVEGNGSESAKSITFVMENSQKFVFPITDVTIVEPLFLGHPSKLTRDYPTIRDIQELEGKVVRVFERLSTLGCPKEFSKIDDAIEFAFSSRLMVAR